MTPKNHAKKHIRNVRTNEQRRNTAVASGKCPRCGGTLILRHGPYGPFYGCSNYPPLQIHLKTMMIRNPVYLTR